MHLFSENLRSFTGPAAYAEPHFTYLDRSARAPFARVRELIESWLNDYPAFHRKSLVRRLRNTDNEHFDAAFFELYLHQLLHRLGCRIRVSPRVGRTTLKRPDFEITCPDGKRWLLEATSSGDLSADERKAEARLVTALNTLNRLRVKDYFLDVSTRGRPRSPIPGKQLRHTVREFLRSLNYDQIREIYAQQSYDELPKTTFEHDGCKLRIRVVPKSPAFRDDSDPDSRAIGMISAGVRWIDSRSGIRDAIRRKATRYGRLRRPLVVAVNAPDQSLGLTDVMEALLGKEQLAFSNFADPKVKPTFTRAADGAWLGPKGPTNTRVSAVLIVSSLLPWTAHVHEPTIYHHPWARYPVMPAFPQLPYYRPNQGHMDLIAGSTAARILGIDPAILVDPDA